MNALWTGFAGMALIGLFLSVLSHLCGWLGVTGPLGASTSMLHLGIFVVWPPAILASWQETQHVPPKDAWKAMLRGCPTWMIRALYGLFGYAILNFILFLGTGGGPSGESGAGMPPHVVRGFSGHWMVFYAVAFGVFYARLQRGPFRPRTCPKGHPVTGVAEYCGTCGSKVDPPSTHPS